MRLAAIVLAKSPRPGHVKTRLCPPCTPTEASAIAAASLEETIDAVAGCRHVRRVIAVDDDVTIPGFETIRQRGEGLAERLAGAFEDVGGPALLVGMDTPQLTSRSLEAAFAALERCDSVIGPTEDGGYWGIGLHGPRFRELFVDVPMSRPDTWAHQLRRLHASGLDPVVLPVVRDVDVFDDALAVARLIPDTRFAGLVRAIARERAPVA